MVNGAGLETAATGLKVLRVVRGKWFITNDLRNRVAGNYHFPTKVGAIAKYFSASSLVAKLR